MNQFVYIYLISLIEQAAEAVDSVCDLWRKVKQKKNGQGQKTEWKMDWLKGFDDDDDDDDDGLGIEETNDLSEQKKEEEEEEEVRRKLRKIEDKVELKIKIKHKKEKSISHQQKDIIS